MVNPPVETVIISMVRIPVPPDQMRAYARRGYALTLKLMIGKNGESIIRLSPESINDYKSYVHPGRKLSHCPITQDNIFY